MLAQEVEAEERLHLAPINLDWRTPIKAVEHDAICEAGLLQMAFERLVVAPLDLVGEQQRQERGCNRVAARVPVPGARAALARAARVSTA